MKIALICTEKLPVPSIRGGAIQILIDGILPYLNINNNITVFCIHDDKLKDYEIQDGIEYVRVSKDGYQFNVAKYIALNNSSYKKFDLIHIFNRPKDLLIYKSASPESRFVLSLHNEMFKEGKISYEMGNLVITACEKIMTVSNYIRDTIIRRFPSAADKVSTIYSGVDLNRYHTILDYRYSKRRNVIRKKYGIKSEKVILFVGRLSKVKGVDILIQSFFLLQKTHPNTVLLVVGSKWFSDDTIDEYGEKVRNMVKDFGLNNVIFTGFISPEKIPDIFLAGDLFVCSSQWQEPLARVHYEAMATALPIITTNRGGNAEIFVNNETGIIIDDYNNADIICDRMKYVLDNCEFAYALGKAAYKEVSKKYGFQHVNSRLVNLYQQALSSKKDMVDYTSLIEIACSILQQYSVVFDNIEVISFKARKAIWKIQTSTGKMILKRISLKDKRMEFMVWSINYLLEQGCKTPSIVKTYNDKEFIEYEGYYYILFKYIEGRKADYYNKCDMRILVGGLAEFHNCSVGIGDKIDCYISGKATNQYKNYESALLARKQQVDLENNKCQFDQLFNSFIDQAIEQCNYAKKFLGPIETPNKDLLVLCHDDYTAGNVIINEKNEIYITDMDSVSINFAPKDIRKLCNKIMKELESGWDLDKLMNIYLVYTSVRGLSDFEKKYLLMELWYPHLFYEQVEKYYNNKEIEWSSEKYIRQLQKAIKLEKSKHRVLQEFENLINI